MHSIVYNIVLFLDASLCLLSRCVPACACPDCVKHDATCVTNKTGRLLFKSQRSLSVPNAKDDKSTDDAEQQVYIVTSTTILSLVSLFLSFFVDILYTFYILYPDAVPLLNRLCWENRWKYIFRDCDILTLFPLYIHGRDLIRGLMYSYLYWYTERS